MLRLCVAPGVVFAGIAFAVHDALNAAYFSAISFVLAGLLAASPFLFGFSVWETSLWQVGASVCAGFAVLFVFFETSGFDVEKQKLQLDVVSDLTESAVQPDNPWRLPPENLKLAQATLIECLGQGSRDIMQSTIAADKAIHFGPGTSLVDASVQALTGKIPQDRCLSGFAILYKASPLMFTDITNNYQKWLKKNGLSPN